MFRQKAEIVSQNPLGPDAGVMTIHRKLSDPFAREIFRFLDAARRVDVGQRAISARWLYRNISQKYAVANWTNQLLAVSGGEQTLHRKT
jgi:hypothetical protein